VRALGLHHRNEAEDQGDEGRASECDDHRTYVHTNGADPRDLRRCDRDKRAKHHESKQQRHDGAC